MWGLAGVLKGIRVEEEFRALTDYAARLIGRPVLVAMDPAAREPRALVDGPAEAADRWLADPEVVCLPSERPRFLAFARALAEDLAPVGAAEQLWVDRIIVQAWRLRCLTQDDTALSAAVAAAPPERMAAALSARLRAGVAALRLESSIERALLRASYHLRRLQDRRLGCPVPERLLDAAGRQLRQIAGPPLPALPAPHAGPPAPAPPPADPPATPPTGPPPRAPAAGGEKAPLPKR